MLMKSSNATIAPDIFNAWVNKVLNNGKFIIIGRNIKMKVSSNYLLIACRKASKSKKRKK